jgi:hypothetical protein
MQAPFELPIHARGDLVQLPNASHETCNHLRQIAIFRLAGLGGRM